MLGFHLDATNKVIANLKKEIESLKRKNEASHWRAEDWRGRFKSSEGNVAKLKAKLQRAASMVAHLRDKNMRLQKRIKELETHITAHSAEKQAIKESNMDDILPKIHPVRDDNFNKDVIDRSYKQLVVVWFWAPWCGPCKAIKPCLDDLAKQMDNVKFVSVNTDEEEKTSRAYSIRGIPSVYVFQNGQVIETTIGAVPKSTLANVIQKHLPREEHANVQ